MTPSQYRLAAELVGMIHEDFQGFHPGYRDAAQTGWCGKYAKENDL